MTATPFHTVLIANRGEIACRIARTARRMGYGIVAVYSAADADAPHVRGADRAICIGGEAPAESYLRIDRIVAAARAAGADAVHPGYGFLAEAADFAAACRAAGLVFIGPDAASIRAMADKAGAKRLVAAAGVPVVPGYQGEDQSEHRLLDEAARIGFPVMIKATAGGGGRGMRLVADADALPGLLRMARAEAEAAFGDATVILERAVPRPRHVEIQVFGDRHGNAVHLGERDCSVQRRHQKLIEEAPSPAVDPALRARMGETALQAVRAIAYEGAGTLEYLLDGQGAFYFMEMNTRLQVEHPVTEAITGLDLVEWQLRIAAGEALPLTQDAIRFTGHAIEVRLCAEDPARDFMPQSGRLLRWSPPPDVRVEHALSDGAMVAPFYDSMIAKLVAHGPTRDAARRALAAGLRRTVALGISTNQDFLRRCLEHPSFAAGEATTAFVAEYGDALRAAHDPADMAGLLALLLHAAAAPPAYATLAPPFAIPMRLEIGGTVTEVVLQPLRGGHFTATWAGRTDRLVLRGRAGDRVDFLRNDVAGSACCVRAAELTLVQIGATAWCVRDLTHAAATRAAPGADGVLRAAMNGRVAAVLVAVGEAVRAGQPVLTLEAMKMQSTQTAPRDGVVAQIAVAVGDQVQTGRIVAALRAEA